MSVNDFTRENVKKMKIGDRVKLIGINYDANSKFAENCLKGGGLSLGEVYTVSGAGRYPCVYDKNGLGVNIEDFFIEFVTDDVINPKQRAIPFHPYNLSQFTTELNKAFADGYRLDDVFTHKGIDGDVAIYIVEKE